MFRFAILATILSLSLAACSSGGTSPATAPPTQPPAATTATGPASATEPAPASAQATVPPPAQPAAATSSPATAASPSPAAAGDVVRFEIIPEQSEARYRVKEQLVGRDLPGDAVGTTQSVAGAITLAPNGSVVSEQSKITVDLQTLKSDDNRRDNFLRNNTLQVNQNPTAEFLPKAVRGLPMPLPASGSVDLELDGDLVLRGVTKPVTWRGTVEVAGQQVTGTAETAVKFGDFNMSQPRVPLVLSVEDNIRLEIDFTLRRAS